MENPNHKLLPEGCYMGRLHSVELRENVAQDRFSPSIHMVWQLNYNGEGTFVHKHFPRPHWVLDQDARKKRAFDLSVWLSDMGVKIAPILLETMSEDDQVAFFSKMPKTMKPCAVDVVVQTFDGMTRNYVHNIKVVENVLPFVDETTLLLRSYWNQRVAADPESIPGSVDEVVEAFLDFRRTLVKNGV